MLSPKTQCANAWVNVKPSTRITRQMKKETNRGELNICSSEKNEATRE